MDQKSSFVLISALAVSIVTLSYLFFDNGKDSVSKTSPKVAHENSTYEPEKEDNIDEDKSISDDIKQKSKTVKNNFGDYLKKKKKIHHTSLKSVAVKQYEKEDTNVFISRIENEIEEAGYFNESASVISINENTYERTYTNKIKQNKTIAAHKKMLLSHRSKSNDSHYNYR